MSGRAVPRLHLVGPLDTDPQTYPRIAMAAVSGGCDGVHVRMPRGATSETLAIARSIQASIGNAALIINDRIDVALLLGASGVHLGERGFTVSEARQIVPDTLLIGRSIHDVDGAKAAADAGADYLLAGHIFDTPSKQGLPGRGLDWLRSVVSTVDIPVIAIGGITTGNLASVIGTGAHGVAIGRELLLADEPTRRANDIVGLIHKQLKG